MRRLNLLPLIIVLPTLAASAIGQTDDYDFTADPLVNPPTLSQPAPDDPDLIARDETLYLSLKANPNTLNPILMSSAPEDRVRELVFDRPLEINHRLEWIINDDVVESFEFAPDHRSAMMKLKPGRTWHDGHPYTAADVVFSWRQIMDTRVPCPVARSTSDQITDCTALDPLTVKFTFAAALATNKWQVMFEVIPQHIYEKEKDNDPSLTRGDYYNHANRNPIGNGPYRFVEWVPDDKVVLERWDGYHGRKPLFKRVVLRIIPNPVTRLNLFERGRIQEFEMTPRQFAVESDNERFRRVGVKGYGQQWKYIFICWNQDGSNPFFADRRVRGAMNHAINYDRLVRQVYSGVYARSHGLHHPSAPMYNPDIELFDFDLERAAQLLDEAGWHRDPDDGWRYKKIERDGKKVRTRFAFALMVPRESMTSPKVAAILKDDLARIGVDMDIRVIDWATFNELRRQHEFEAHIAAWTAGKDPDDERNLWTTEAYKDGRNYGGYSNPQVDKLYESARKCFNEKERMAHYAKISKIIYEDAPYAFLVNAPILWAFDKHLRGVTYSPRGPCHFYPGVRDWWIHKKDIRPAGE